MSFDILSLQILLFIYFENLRTSCKIVKRIKLSTFDYKNSENFSLFNCATSSFPTNFSIKELKWGDILMYKNVRNVQVDKYFFFY